MKTQFIDLVILLFLSCAASFAQWLETNGPNAERTVSFAVCNTDLFAGTTRGVFRSADNGASWTAVNSGLTDASVSCLNVLGSYLFAGTTGGIFRSIDNGGSWATSGLNGQAIGPLASFGMNLLAGAGRGIFLSTDFGGSWRWMGTMGEAGGEVVSIVVHDTDIFAGAYYGGVFHKTANDTGWTLVGGGFPNTSAYCIAVSGNTLVAGTRGCGVFRSTNNGTNWTAAGSVPGEVLALITSGSDLFAGTTNGVSVSTDNGISWANTGLSNTIVYSLAISDGNLFAGTYDHGVWRRPLSQMTLVARKPSGLPIGFGLEQNYPNPFNPTTAVSFQVPVASMVRLVVCDLLGREVAILINEKKEPGSYRVDWDATGLSSGVYFCRLSAGSFVSTKKMILTK